MSDALELVAELRARSAELMGDFPNDAWRFLHAVGLIESQTKRIAELEIRAIPIIASRKIVEDQAQRIEEQRIKIIHLEALLKSMGLVKARPEATP